MAVEGIQRTPENIELHPNLQRMDGLAETESLLEYEFNLGDRGLVLEGCMDRIPGKRELGHYAEDLVLLLNLIRDGMNPPDALTNCRQKIADKTKIHTLVMRWGETAKTGVSGRRYYMAKGIALAVIDGTDGVDLLRTDQIDRAWVSYDAHSKKDSYLRDYPNWTWEARLQRAIDYATPIAADLYRYDSSLKHIPNKHRGLGTVCRRGYSKLLMWAGKVNH